MKPANLDQACPVCGEPLKFKVEAVGEPVRTSENEAVQTIEVLLAKYHRCLPDWRVDW